MRRGRIICGIAAAIVACFVVVPAPAFAAGGTPMDICHDLQDGKLDGHYTQAQLNAFNSDPTVQGYCSAVAVAATVTPKAPAPASHTPAPASPVLGAQHTQRATAPVVTSRRSGTLPFTGLQLSVVLAFGLALIGAGLALRYGGRAADER
jgi:hypothetical protein